MKNLNYLVNFTLSLGIILGQVVPHDPPLHSVEEHIHFIDWISGKHKQSLDLIKSIQKNEGHFCSQTGIRLQNDSNAELTFIGAVLKKDDKIYIRYIDSSGYIGPFSREHFNDHGLLTVSGVESGRIVIEYCTSSFDTESKLYLTHVESMSDRIHKSIQKSKIRSMQNREHKVVMVTGFWPPTNEMIRQFSQDSTLNPWGWQGENFEDSGYDVVSFFPEFEDPDCSNCGMGYGHLEVDYQDTSEDFWLLVEQVQPIAIITFSRGYMDQSWELEYNYYNRTNWINDYLTPLLPTPNPPDNDEANFFMRNSTLPMESIRDAVQAELPTLNPYIDWAGDPGHFVSEFMGYHGVWYRDSHQFSDEPCIIAGHVHVGGLINWGTARDATEVTIRTVLEYLNQFEYTSGDLNDDSMLNIQDILLIVQIIIGIMDPTISQELAADMNQDDIINVLDVIILVNSILGV